MTDKEILIKLIQGIRITLCGDCPARKNCVFIEDINNADVSCRGRAIYTFIQRYGKEELTEILL